MKYFLLQKLVAAGYLHINKFSAFVCLSIARFPFEHLKVLCKTYVSCTKRETFLGLNILFTTCQLFFSFVLPFILSPILSSSSRSTPA
jgi:hypothetical protein